MHILKKQSELESVEDRRGANFFQTFAALKHRNFRLFWSSQLISLIGTWMQTTGQAWLVLQLTHSAFLLGVVGALQFLPIMFFALYGGVLADRLPKRTLLLCTQSFSAILAATLWFLVITGTVQLWHVMLLAFLLGCANAMDMPSRQSLVVEMVGREDLSNAVALNSSIFNMARIVGPGIAGIIIARFGEAPLFFLNALSFVPVVICLASIQVSKLFSQPRLEDRQGTFKSVQAGLSYTIKTPVILLIILTVGFISLFGINFNVTLPLFANDVLNVGAQGYGFISAAFGIGALLSALWIAWRNHGPSINQIVIGGLFFSVFEILFAISHVYLLSLLLIAAVGFAQIAFSAMANTTLQMVTPNHLRGRIMSVYMLVFAGTNPIGNLMTGGAAHAFGASIALLVSGIISLLSAIIAWIFKGSAVKGIKEYSRIAH